AVCRSTGADFPVTPQACNRRAYCHVLLGCQLALFHCGGVLLQRPILTLVQYWNKSTHVPELIRAFTRVEILPLSLVPDCRVVAAVSTPRSASMEVLPGRNKSLTKIQRYGR